MLPPVLLPLLLAAGLPDAVLPSAAANAAGVPTTATRLRVEGLELQQQGEDGLVVLSEQLPRFAFSHSVPNSNTAAVPRGLAQAAYHIKVHSSSVSSSSSSGSGSSSSSSRSSSSSGGNATTVWDSGVVRSANCSEIVYAGEPLRAFEAYTWSVAWLGTDGRWSIEATSTFEMGPVEEADWASAAWLIGSQLRAEFQLPSPPVRARAYLAAAGCGALEINGARPSPDTRGVCAWTVFEKRAHYQTHDITQLLRQGANAVGILSNQIDSRRKRQLPSPLARAILRIELADGSAPVLLATAAGGEGSGEGGWSQAESWTTMNGNGRDWFMHMNWTAEEAGWSSSGFLASEGRWSPAVSRPSPTTATSAQQMPLATVIERVPPVNATQIASNSSHDVWLYDFGQNMVGTIELQPLPAAISGSQLALTHGEWLETWRRNHSAVQRCDPQTCSAAESDGEYIVPVVSGGLQTVLHTLRENISHPLAPIFAWHGFQYVTIVAEHGTSFKGGLEALTALRIHTNVSVTGELDFGGDGIAGSESENSAEVFNGVQKMLTASQLSNLAAYIPMSCPTTEKQGWMGDALFASEESMYNFDMQAIYTSFLHSVQDNQGPVSGDVPYVVPGSTPGPSSCNDLAWSSAYPEIAALLGGYYGDFTVADRHWDSLTNYTDNAVHNAVEASDGVAVCDQFLDWVTAGVCDSGMCAKFLSPKCTDSTRCPVGEEMAGFSYVQGLRAMAAMAQQLGVKANYSSLAAAATVGFHKRFWNETSQSYGSDLSGQQMLSIPALTIAAMPDSAVRSHVVDLLRTDLWNRSGHHLQIGAVTSKPYLSMLSAYGLHSSALRVAAQRTEPGWGYWLSQGATTCWEKWPGDTSKNHIFLCGGFGEWLWKHVIGLQHTSPGFATVRIAPRLDGYYGPSRADGRFRSTRGEISVAWERSDASNGSSIGLQVGLPLGVAQASVLVPPPYEAQSAAPDEVVCAVGGTHGAKQVAITSQNALEDYPKVVHLECSGGGHIHSIDFASYGTTLDASTGSCDTWAAKPGESGCQVANASAVVESLCVNQVRCSIVLSNATFVPDPCPHEVKTLAVRATCTGGVVRERAAKFVATEGGQMIWDGTKAVVGKAGAIAGIVSVRASADEDAPGLVVEVQSGDYRFESRLAS